MLGRGLSRVFELILAQSKRCGLKENKRKTTKIVYVNQKMFLKVCFSRQITSASANITDFPDIDPIAFGIQVLVK
jgi:hypothetical protein